MPRTVCRTNHAERMREQDRLAEHGVQRSVELQDDNNTHSGHTTASFGHTKVTAVSGIK